LKESGKGTAMSHEFSAGAGGESSAPESGAGPPRDDHPTPEELLAFHFGALETVDRDRVEDHLSRCPECAQLVLDFAAFPELEPVEETTLELERRLEEQRRGLIRQLREGGAEPGRGSEERPPPGRQPSEGASGRVVPGPWKRRLRIAWGVAAVFFVATVGLALWMAAQGGFEGGRADEPSPVRYETLNTSIRRSETAPVEISATKERTFLHLTVNPARRDFPEYRLVLLDASGQRVWMASGFHPDSKGRIGLLVDGRWQPPGRYLLEIYGSGRGEPQEVGRQIVELATPVED
jgi:hypothetical protein